MGFTSMIIGGGIGFASQLFANAARKVPLSRQPWMHAFMFSAGCYAGVKYSKWEASALESLNKLRAEMGLPPLVGSVGWIRFEPEGGNS